VVKPFGADDRPGYVSKDVANGYDRWAARYDRNPNPLIAQFPDLADYRSIPLALIMSLSCPRW
jgi:hypothetical protein